MLPDLGVGIIYSSGLEPLIAAHPELIDVIEIEPQTLWIETADPTQPYRQPGAVLEHLANLPTKKLVHSVGTPVGGSVRAHAAQVPLLREAISALGAPWASEHLSFNLTHDFFTGFFLPPRQTSAGVTMYVDAIRRLQDALGLPLAIETPVNYLRARADEMPDGEFVATVAERAECGVLLDLHNIYCNERNGRQRVDDFVACLPRARVWEVHLAGGFELKGFWLDAHSGAIPPPLLAMASQIIPTVPQLRAIIFELFPSFLPAFGLDAMCQELQAVRQLWASRGRGDPTQRSVQAIAIDSAPSPPEWEHALGRVVVGREPASPLEIDLATEPGAQLMQALIKEFRGSMVVGVYRLTCRVLMLALGTDMFRSILERFWSAVPPRQFSASEGDAFADYLEATGLAQRLRLLPPVLAFERATIATLRDGQVRIVRFDHDPFPLLRALSEGMLPEDLGRPGEFEIEITGEGPLDVTMREPSGVPFH